LILATFIPARRSFWITSWEFEAGTVVQTSLVL
jgi:hypothetical protein